MTIITSGAVPKLHSREEFPPYSVGKHWPSAMVLKIGEGKLDFFVFSSDDYSGGQRSVYLHYFSCCPGTFIKIK